MATSMKGFVLDIGGNLTPLNDAMKGVNTTSKNLQFELKEVEKGLKLNPDNVILLEQKQKLLAQAVENTKEKLEALKLAEKNAQEQLQKGEISEAQYRQLQREIVQTERTLKGFEEQASNTTDDVNKLGNETEASGEQVKDSGENAQKGGDGWEKFGSVVSTVGKVIAGVGIAIGAATVAATKALTDMSIEAAAYADEILTTSTVTGMSIESLQAYKYAAELVDVSLETLTSSMAKQVRSMDSARDGNKKMQEAYNELGVSVADSNGKLRDGETVYWESIDALGRVEEGAERDAIAMQIFGKSAQELNPLIAQGSAGIKDLTEEAHRMGAVMSEDAINDLGKFDDSVQRIKAGSEAAKHALGMVLLPQLQSLADDGVDLLGDFTTGLNDAGDDWNKVSETVGNIVKSIAEKIVEKIPEIIQLGLDVMSALGSAIMENLPTLIESATMIITTILQGLVDALPQLTDGAVQMLLALANGLIENLPKLVEAAIYMVVALAQGISDSLPTLIPSVVDCILLIVETLLDNIDMLVETAVDLIVALAEGLINAYPVLLEKAPVIIVKLVEAFIELLPRIVELGVKLIVQLGAGFVKGLGGVLSGIPKLIGQLVDSFKNAISKFNEIGKDIIEGIWEGIKSTAKWLGDKISGFFTGIVDGIKKTLGINSPSTLFRDLIGKNMIRGIGVGIELETPNLQDTLNDSLNKVSAGMNTTLDIEQGNLAAAQASQGATDYGGFHFHIDKVENANGRDAQDFAEDVMVEIEEIIRRRRGVFA